MKKYYVKWLSREGKEISTSWQTMTLKEVEQALDTVGYDEGLIVRRQRPPRPGCECW